MDTLRFGVLGAADIATEKVVPAMQRGDRTEVVAIGSRDHARARRVADELGVPRAHGSYDDVLADDDVDAVYIPLPNHLHAPWTTAAAEAGKHVLCEKPMAMDADEAHRMVAACADAGVVFMEAFMYRVHPQWRRIRDLIAAGALGDVQMVQSHFTYFNDDPDDIRNVADYGGGGLMDIGCYCIDVPRFVYGTEPEEVTGVVRVDPGFGTDVLASGALGFPDMRHATFTCSTLGPRSQGVQILGTAGRLVVQHPFTPPRDGPTRLWIEDVDGTREVIVPGVDQYTLQGDLFAAAVLDGAPVPVPHTTGPAVLDVIARLRSS